MVVFIVTLFHDELSKHVALGGSVAYNLAW